MIEIYDSYSVYDLLFSYAKTNNCALMYFHNPFYSCLEENKKNEILEFYQEFLPEDILLKIKNTNDCIIKFETVDYAVMCASEWFPPEEKLPESYYYWKCYVISPEGEFEYENIIMTPSEN